MAQVRETEGEMIGSRTKGTLRGDREASTERTGAWIEQAGVGQRGEDSSDSWGSAVPIFEYVRFIEAQPYLGRE